MSDMVYDFSEFQESVLRNSLSTYIKSINMTTEEYNEACQIENRIEFMRNCLKEIHEDDQLNEMIISYNKEMIIAKNLEKLEIEMNELKNVILSYVTLDKTGTKNEKN